MITVAEPGSIFAGKYKVEKLIGTGGMGVIISATHMQLEQRVAIKLLTSDAATDPERVGRFSREAKAAARIQSEHVVRILDYGTHPSGAPFIVMEHLVGSDLAMAVKTRGGLPLDEAVDYMIQACDGVAEAHVAGIIHRDLKPANLFLTRKKDGGTILKVLDFGASKLTAECSLATSDMSKTHASSLIGSPRYMAPEQLKAAHEIDSRADIYALGATLFELLAGEPVFKAESISRIFTKILWDAPPSITQFRDDVPAGLDALLFRCLQKRPEDRYQTVKELVVALAEFAPERSAGLVAQVARIGKPPASIAPPPKPVMKAQSSSADGEHAPPPGARPSEPGTTDGSASMSTMAVLRAAQVDSKGRRTLTMVAALAATLVVAAAVFVFVIRPKMVGTQPPKAAATSTGAPTETFVANVPPVSPPPATAVVADAGVTAAVASTTSPVRPVRTGSERPTAATTPKHTGRPGTTGTGATTAKPETAPTTKPTGDFTDFGNRKMTHRLSQLRVGLFTASLLASIAFAPMAHADTESDKAGAQAAFDMGKKLMVEGKYVEACPKLAESVRLDPGVGAMLFLADCYERTGRTASAWAVFREAESLGSKQGDNRERVAKERANALEPKLSKLVIVLAPAESGLAGVKVRRDGADVGPALWGSPIPTDPGTHEIVVSAPGKKSWKGSVQIASNGATETVTVPALEDGPREVDTRAANGTGTVVAPPTEAAGSDGSSQRTIGVVVGVSGLALIGLGAGFGFSAKSSLDESNADNHCREGNRCDAIGVAARDDAKSAALISTIGFIAGGAALLGGTVLYFTAPKRDTKPAALRVVPTGGPSSAGLMLHAAW